MVGVFGEEAAYLEDFEFIRETVGESGAAVEVRGVDWEKWCDEMRPRFVSATSDGEHVANVMRLLAVLEDSHTNVTQSTVAWDELPSKWDGLYGGGMLFGWEDGRVMLRGVMAGHPLEGKVSPGMVLVGIGGEPVREVLARDRERVAEFSGISRWEQFYAVAANRLLPFGEAHELELVFMDEEGKETTVETLRWGPEGKPFVPWDLELPDGVVWAEGAVGTMLEYSWCSKVGYLRITGSMDEATVKAFNEVFDSLEGMEALILDCRWMGGGSDFSAWAMAGRFFEKGVENGPYEKLGPEGAWQFTGPVVLLQDETMVSSAETFAWAMTETGRAVSVGQSTGGWGIIPKGFECPSGLVSFRLGVNHRPTPITKKLTEGVGWPAMIEVPYGVRFCAWGDFVREIGTEVLGLLYAGMEREEVVALFGELFRGEYREYMEGVRAAGDVVKGWDGAALGKRVREDLEATLEMELAMLEVEGADLEGSRRRLGKLGAVGKAGGFGELVERWERALREF